MFVAFSPLVNVLFFNRFEYIGVRPRRCFGFRRHNCPALRKSVLRSLPITFSFFWPLDFVGSAPAEQHFERTINRDGLLARSPLESYEMDLKFDSELFSRILVKPTGVQETR